MSVDTHAIIENRLAAGELRTIAYRLSAKPSLVALMREYDTVLRRICPTLLANLHADPWELELLRLPEENDHKLVESGWDAGNLLECRGPFGTICVYENLADVSWYMCRWYAFLTDAEFRMPLFEATRLVSTTLNGDAATTAVFVPDSAYTESLALDELHRTMPELLAWLRENCGPPAETLESIVQEDGNGNHTFNGYYLARWPASGVGT